MIKIYDNPIFRQYLVVITVNLCVLATGTSLMWSSPVLVKLKNSTQTVLPEPITDEEGSWIVAIGSLFGIIVSFCIPYIADRLGRKYGLILACLPRIIVGFLFVFATQVWMLLLGRAILGVTDSIIFTLVPMYASEMANKDIRGSLGSILQILCSFGVVIMLSIGPFVSYIAVNSMLLVLFTLTTLPLFFLPDSPYFLYSKGKQEEALKVLTFYRNSAFVAQEEIKQYEADSLKQENVNLMDILRDRLFLKSLVLVTILALGSQFVGFNAIIFYLQTVLESTQTTVRPEIASVIIGLIQLTASFGTTFMTDKFGRKPILSITCAGMALGMLGLGIFFKLKELGAAGGILNYVPLMSLILVVYCYSAGFGSLFWVMGAELFNDRSRAMGMSIALIIMGTSIFITTKCFAQVTNAIGPAYTYWGFSVICVIMLVFILFFIPETKGKSFAEIQDILRNKNVKSEYNTKC